MLNGSLQVAEAGPFVQNKLRAALPTVLTAKYSTRIHPRGGSPCDPLMETTACRECREVHEVDAQTHPSTTFIRTNTHRMYWTYYCT